MNTMTLVPHRARRLLGRSLVALALGITPAILRADIRPPADDGAAVAAPAMEVPSDPYLAYLSAVGATWASCRPAAEALQALLEQQAALLAEFARNPAARRAGLDARFDSLDQRIHAAEAELDAALAAMRAAQPPPPKVELPPLDPKEITRPRRSRRHEVRVITLPPCNLDVPYAPPPAREVNYLSYLNARAAGSATAKSFADQVRGRIDDRRELCMRFFKATPIERPGLTLVVEAVTTSLHSSERGVREVEALRAAVGNGG